MEKYKCDICKKNHSVYYSSYDSMPRKVSDMLLKDESHRIEKVSESHHLIDNSYLIVKGLILIETTFTEYPINHEAWIEIPIKEYTDQLEDAKGKPTLTLKGKLATELPFYKDFTGLNANWILNEKYDFGQIQITSDSRLKTDQSEPITEDRVIEMMQLIHHPELLNEKPVFDSSFQSRFIDIIKKAKEEYFNKGSNFLIDISNQKEILFQLISSKMLSIESNGGIGLHLSNDKTNDDFKLVNSRMSSICKEKMIKIFQLDGIETYQKNYEFSDDSLFKDVELILKSVYEENIEELEIEISEV